MTMTLIEFIQKHGDAKCASLFKVKERTIASWRRGENFPRAKKAREIVERTGGKVGMDGIYRATPQQSERVAA